MYSVSPFAVFGDASRAFPEISNTDHELQAELIAISSA